MSITLSELHDDEDDNVLDPTPINPNDDGDNPSEPTPPVDPTDDSNPDDTSPADPDNDPEVSGIEQYLIEHGIDAGMISIEREDGEASVHFNDLTDGEQFNVLKDLAERGGSTIGSEYGLDDNETRLVNFVRSQEGSVEDIIEGMAQQRVDEMMALQGSASVDITTMTSDAVYTKWLQETNPNASDDEIAEELTSAKEGKFYETNVDRIKQDMILSQQVVEERKNAEDMVEYQKDLDNDRSTIVNAVEGIDNVMGFQITDDAKNDVLANLLETGESGDSLFMEEVFSDPSILFKAAVMHYHGEDHINALEDYYKKEVTKAYKRGAKTLIDGATPIVVHGNKSKGSNAGTDAPPAAPRQSNRITMDELHNE